MLGLQQSRNIDFAEVLKHELAPLPTSVFKDDGEMQIAATKSDLKRQLQVCVSARLVEKVDAAVIDGCALLWTVHWPEKGTVNWAFTRSDRRTDWSARPRLRSAGRSIRPVGPTGRTDSSRTAHICQSNQCGVLAD